MLKHIYMKTTWTTEKHNKMDKDLFDKAEYFMKINEEDFDKVTAKLEELEV